MGNTLMTIPLCQLKRSKTNIRKTEPLSGLEELSASIEVNGVLENLVVLTMEKTDPADADLYEVIAGGRRLAALKLLLKNKKIAKDHPVPCLVMERSGGANPVEISLAENIVRAPVHPADQFEAFQKLQKEGLPAEDIAARFGIAVNVVLQRLKLAAVSPRLMSEYRSGNVTLEHMVAFAITDDHKAQEEAWFHPPFGDTSPQAIRRYLTKSHVEGTDRRAKFVGAKAYEEAGGIIVRDLFQPEDEGYFTDSQLLDRLAAEKLEAEAGRIRAEGWGWVETARGPDFGQLGRFGRIRVVEVELPAEDEERLASLCERYDELVAVLEDEEDKEMAAEFDQVTAELDILRARKEVWPEDEKSRAGVILSLDYNGRVHAERGLIRPEDMARESEPEPAGELESEEAAESGTEKPEGTVKNATGYSESLLVDLSAHRTMALREVLASRPEKALTALLHTFVRQVFFHERPEGCVAIAATVTDLGKSSETVGGSKAAEALHSRHKGWSERFPARKDLWAWLEGLDLSARLELLAFCTAMTVDAVRRSWKDLVRVRQADMLAREFALDMTAWWEPTASGFFDRLTKVQILNAIEEGVSKEAALRLNGRKKSQMGHDAEFLLKDKAWLPVPLRTPVAETDGSGATLDAAAE
jgi:ParB family transcriptional regulator, chromosome partitioning protein